MIIIKSDEEIDLMRISGKVTGTILKELETFIKPGISTEDIDRFVETTIRDHGMIPTFKGYGGFPASACVSINEEVVHGIPARDRITAGGRYRQRRCRVHLQRLRQRCGQNLSE